MRQLVFGSKLVKLMLEGQDLGQEAPKLRFGSVDVFHPAPGKLQRVLALAVFLVERRQESSALLCLHLLVTTHMPLLVRCPGTFENWAGVLEERLDRRPHLCIDLVGGHKLAGARRSITLIQRQ